MCGIVGKLNFDRQPVAESDIVRMCDAITHRGPDDSGTFCGGFVGLGARRLSIIDLAGGHMPISNEDGSIWISFNGEIYNFLELRKELIQAGHQFTTRTDTEVIVHLYEQDGVDCLQRLNGMFAFAIWDQRRQRLFLARDRLGQKPLCYALLPEGLVFASEIYALLQDPAIPRDLDYEALDLYLTLMYVPSPLSIFRAIRRLPPSHYLVWESDQVSIQRYWDIPYGLKSSLEEDEAIEELRSLLKDAVQRRLISDVPLGAFLSGGIDSSVIVSLMSEIMSEPVKTFSIGYTARTKDELQYARQVAQRYGTDHHEFIVEPQLVDILPKLSRHYGEPFGDESAVATYYVSQLARQSVTVALSGDGGDEAFGGYVRCISALHPTHMIPAYLRDGYHSLLRNVRRANVRHMLGAVKGTALGIASTVRELNQPLLAWANRMTFLSSSVRRRLYSDDLRHRLGVNGTPWAIRNLPADKMHWPVLDKMFYLDQSIYLPDDILFKVDIASMANSLEVRSPLLDYRVVELSASLPSHMKIQNGETKRIFRRTFGDLLPRDVLVRKKMGFSIPIEEWMRNDLHPMTYDLLTDRSARERGLFNQVWVKEMLARHKTGIGDYARQLWLLLNFEIWCRTIGDQFGVTFGAQET